MHREFSVRLGWRVLIPGLTQMTWRQRERGMVYLVSLVTSLGTSLFCWGSLLGWCFLAFCFLTHLAASLDVVRQRAFPVFPRSIALAAAILGMGLTVYLPTGTLLRFCAFSTCSGVTGDGYLVNRLAYQERKPSPGHYIWMRLSPVSSPRAGQMLAVAGQEVEWTGRWQGHPVGTSRGAPLLPECLAVPGAAQPRSHRARDRQHDGRTWIAFGDRKQRADCWPGLGPILSILGTLPALTRPRATFLGWSSKSAAVAAPATAFEFKVENSTRCQNPPESARDNQGMPGMMKY